MAIQVDDFVSTNLVIIGINLLETPEQLMEFRQQVGNPLTIEAGAVTNFPIGLTEPSRRIQLARDRVILELTGSRATITKEFPNTQDPLPDFERLAEVTDCAISLSGVASHSIRSFGYNMELVFGLDPGQSPRDFLGTRLFGEDFRHDEAWDLVGASSQLIFTQGPRQWTFGLRSGGENAPSSRVILGSNVHYEETELPSRQAVLDALNEIWHESRKFMNWLDERA
jgi:hypothetical protein